MRPFPQSRKDAQTADADRIGKAYAAYSGNPPAGAGVPGSSPAAEKEEDAAYAEIQNLIGEMEKILARLRELHQSPAEQTPHEEETEAGAGSPSAQGAV